MNDQDGKASPFAGGVALHSYQSVTQRLEHPTRGLYVGSRPAAEPCFSSGALMFQSEGAQLDKLRDLASLLLIKSNRSELLGDGVVDSVDDLNRHVARNVWYQLFDQKPPQSTVEDLVLYLSQSKACVLGHRVHSLFHNYFLEGIQNTRQRLFVAAAATRAGSNLQSVAMDKHLMTQQQAVDAFQNVVDTLLWVEFSSISAVVANALDRIEHNRQLNTDLWRKNPNAFLKEVLRLDPPIVSVSVLNVKPEQLSISTGWSGTGFATVQLQEGITVELVLASANTDPKAFGGAARSVALAREFRPARSREELAKVLLPSAGIFEPFKHGQQAASAQFGLQLATELVSSVVGEWEKQEEQPLVHLIPDTNLDPWWERYVHGSGLDGIDSSSDSPLNVEIASLFIASCAFFDVMAIKFGAGYGVMTGAYSAVLTHLIVFCVAKAARCDLILPHSAIQMAANMGVMTLIIPAIFYDPAAQAFHSSIIAVERASRQPVHWVSERFISTVALMAHAVCLVIHWNVPDYSYWEFMTYTVILLPAMLVTTFAFVAYGIQQTDPMVRFKILLGSFCFSWIYVSMFVSQCVSPLYAQIYFAFACLPGLYGIVLASSEVDCSMKSKSNRTIQALRQGAVSSNVVVAKVFEFISFSRVGRFIFPSYEHFADGKPNTKLHQAELHTHTVTKLRLALVTALFGAGTLLLVQALSSTITGAQLCFYESDKVKYGALCDMGTEAMHGIDPHTIALYRLLKNLATPRSGEAGTIDWTELDSQRQLTLGARVTIPTEQKKLPKKQLAYCPQAFKQELHSTCTIPTEGDETEGLSNRVSATVSSLIFNLLRSDFFYRLQDIPTEWPSPEEAPRILNAGGETELKMLELVPWQRQMQEDEQISRFAFAGLGAHAMRPVDNDPEGIAFISQWDWMHQFEVRDGFERYGVNAYFDKDAKLVKMFWRPSPLEEGVFVYPGGQHWDHVKYAFKCTVLVGVTAKDHLVGIHFMASNFLTTSSTENLSPTHPLRRMLRPHTYGAVEINLGAVKTLAIAHGVAHRATALTWDGLKSALAASYTLNRYMSFPDSVKSMESTIATDRAIEASSGNLTHETYPYGRDALDFYGVVATMVGDFVDVTYPDDAAVIRDSELGYFWDGLHIPETNSRFPVLTGKRVLVEVLSTYICMVTGVHNQVGNVADYLKDPAFASVKIRPEAIRADVQGSFQGLNVGLMTSQLTPRLIQSAELEGAPGGTFKHLLAGAAFINPVDDLPKAEAIFDQFQSNLVQLSREIDQRNKHRRFPCNAYNPKTMIASVSI